MVVYSKIMKLTMTHKNKILSCSKAADRGGLEPKGPGRLGRRVHTFCDHGPDCGLPSPVHHIPPAGIHTKDMQ
jgi:hypothetical protein